MKSAQGGNETFRTNRTSQCNTAGLKARVVMSLETWRGNVTGEGMYKTRWYRVVLHSYVFSNKSSFLLSLT